MISARVLADSTYDGARLTTFEVVLPKPYLAQFNTYGMVRRNAASSRAVPTRLLVQQVSDTPFMPLEYNYAGKGMQPGAEMDGDDWRYCEGRIQDLLEYTLKVVDDLSKVGPEGRGMAKEDLNRYLEPWAYTVVVATSTEWDNFFTQRLADDAQLPIRTAAIAMQEALLRSAPRKLDPITTPPQWRWHLPYVSDAERDVYPVGWLPLLSARRTAAVSFFRQGVVEDPATTLDKYFRLVESGHWSALEHAALPTEGSWNGPYRHFRSLRRGYAGESGSPNFGAKYDHAKWAPRRAAFDNLMRDLDRHRSRMV